MQLEDGWKWRFRIAIGWHNDIVSKLELPSGQRKELENELKSQKIKTQFDKLWAKFYVGLRHSLEGGKRPRQALFPFDLNLANTRMCSNCWK